PTATATSTTTGTPTTTASTTRRPTAIHTGGTRTWTAGTGPPRRLPPLRPRPRERPRPRLPPRRLRPPTRGPLRHPTPAPARPPRRVTRRVRRRSCRRGRGLGSDRQLLVGQQLGEDGHQRERRQCRDRRGVQAFAPRRAQGHRHGQADGPGGEAEPRQLLHG